VGYHAGAHHIWIDDNNNNNNCPVSVQLAAFAVNLASDGLAADSQWSWHLQNRAARATRSCPPVLHIGVVDGLAKLPWKTLHRSLDVAVRQQGQHLILSRVQCRRRRTRVCLGQVPIGEVLRRVVRRLTPLPAVPVDLGVGQDTEQPGLQIGARPE
jgi:hypothetical protein